MTRTANDLAQFLSCTLEGDGSTLLSGVAAPDRARAEDLIYVDTARHLDRAAASQARCVVLAPGLPLAGKTLLRAANPKLAFARAAAWLAPPAAVAAGIHETSLISPTARLAK
jgi:UDP-3-O-[3-hydroxymyristoyl] glucosamine N-acyltransferase